MLIQVKKVNKCKYSADTTKKQAGKGKKLSVLNQNVINLFDIGINIAVAKVDVFQVNINFLKGQDR